jgi:preprotein translocase subunit Sec61beta
MHPLWHFALVLALGFAIAIVLQILHRFPKP